MIIIIERNEGLREEVREGKASNPVWYSCRRVKLLIHWEDKTPEYLSEHTVSLGKHLLSELYRKSFSPRSIRHK